MLNQQAPSPPVMKGHGRGVGWEQASSLLTCTCGIIAAIRYVVWLQKKEQGESSWLWMGPLMGDRRTLCSPPYLPDPAPILLPDETHPSDSFPEQPQPPPMSIQVSVICVSKGTPVASEGNPDRVFVSVLSGECV